MVSDDTWVPQGYDDAIVKILTQQDMNALGERIDTNLVEAVEASERITQQFVLCADQKQIHAAQIILHTRLYLSSGLKSPCHNVASPSLTATQSTLCIAAGDSHFL